MVLLPLLFVREQFGLRTAGVPRQLRRVVEALDENRALHRVAKVLRLLTHSLDLSKSETYRRYIRVKNPKRALSLGTGASRPTTTRSTLRASSWPKRPTTLAIGDSTREVLESGCGGWREDDRELCWKATGHARARVVGTIVQIGASGNETFATSSIRATRTSARRRGVRSLPATPSPSSVPLRSASSLFGKSPVLNCALQSGVGDWCRALDTGLESSNDDDDARGSFREKDRKPSRGASFDTSLTRATRIMLSGAGRAAARVLPDRARRANVSRERSQRRGVQMMYSRVPRLVRGPLSKFNEEFLQVLSLGVPLRPFEELVALLHTGLNPPLSRDPGARDSWGVLRSARLVLDISITYIYMSLPLRHVRRLALLREVFGARDNVSFPEIIRACVARDSRRRPVSPRIAPPPRKRSTMRARRFLGPAHCAPQS